MILYEQVEPLARAAELDLAGRRVAARLLPYVGEAGEPAWRFDPVSRRFLRRPAEGRVGAGPSEPEAWRLAVARMPAGPVLVGPSSPVEEIRGAAAAAAEGARATGRPVYLLDPDPGGLPAPPFAPFVALFSWQPRGLPAGAAACAARGMPAGLLFPVVPGWTSEPDFLAALLDSSAAAGLAFVSPLLPDHDGEARSAMVQARGEPPGLFERIHHFDWQRDAAVLWSRARRTIREHGLPVMPPRPVGVGEPEGNAVAAGRLEELAEESGGNEHRSSLLHAAARWIEGSGRDLTRVVREGNFRKVFPFGPEITADAEEALRRSP